MRRWAKRPVFCARRAGNAQKMAGFEQLSKLRGVCHSTGTKLLFPDVGKMVGPRVLRDAVRVLGAVTVPAGFVTVPAALSGKLRGVIWEGGTLAAEGGTLAAKGPVVKFSLTGAAAKVANL